MEKMKCLYLPPDTEQMRQVFPESSKRLLEEVVDVEYNDLGRQFTEEELIEKIADKDFAVISWRVPQFTEAVVAAAPKLKGIFHAAGTIKPFVSPAVFEKGIVCTSANHVMSWVTAEAIFAYMMIGNWGVKDWMERMEKGEWKTMETVVPGVQGKTIGIVGLGAITRNLIPMLKPLRLKKIYLMSGHMTDEQAAELGVEKADLDTILKESDIITLNTSLTDKTRHMINADNLPLIKDGALFINAGRGPLCDDEAFIAECKKDRFRVVLDVYYKEPLDPESPLRNLPNVIALPHLGAATVFCREAMGLDTIQNLKEFLDGKPCHSAVDPDEILRMSTR